MNHRFFAVVLAAMPLAACVVSDPAPPLSTPSGRPEIVIHATAERVRSAIVIQQSGEGATLASQSENRLAFVTQANDFASNLLYSTKAFGSPYARTIYVVAPEPPNTRVFIKTEIVSNYNTAFEDAQPTDTPTLRQALQRNLEKVKAIAERR